MKWCLYATIGRENGSSNLQKSFPVAFLQGSDVFALKKGDAKAAEEHLVGAGNNVSSQRRERERDAKAAEEKGDAKAADENLTGAGNNVPPQRKGRRQNGR